MECSLLAGPLVRAGCCEASWLMWRVAGWLVRRAWLLSLRWEAPCVLNPYPAVEGA